MAAWSRKKLYWLAVLAGTAGACRMDYGYLSEGDAPSSAAGQAGTEAVGGTGGTESEDLGGTSPLGGVGGSVAEAGMPPSDAGMSGAGTPGEPRTAIVSQDGRVVPGSNDFGIDGEWRIFGADPSLIVPSFEGNRVCVKGQVLGVKGGDWNRYWGGGVALALHIASPGGAALSYDATQAGLGGLVFVIEGSNVPSRVRLKFKKLGLNDSYCQNVDATSGKQLDLAVAQAVHNCWMPGGEPVDATNLENFEIHIVPEDPNDIAFDFCVTALTATPAAE